MKDHHAAAIETGSDFLELRLLGAFTVAELHVGYAYVARTAWSINVNEFHTPADQSPDTVEE